MIRSIAIAKSRLQEREGLLLTDEIIRDKALAFAAAASTSKKRYVVHVAWLEEFKLKNNLMGAQSRKGSLAPDDADYTSAAASSSPTPKSGTSPISPVATGSPELHSAQSQESLKNESPDRYIDYGRHRPFHSESTNSLHSAYTDTAPSSFSPLGPLSPTSLTSPFFTQDPGVPPLTARPILPASTANNSQRPRSQTFPLLDQYMSGPETATPKHTPSSMLDSPMEEASDPLLSLNEAVSTTQPADQPKTVSPKDMAMRPPPLPSRVKREETSATFHQSPSSEDAKQAFHVLLDFMEQHNSEPADFVQMGKLMEKLGGQSM